MGDDERLIEAVRGLECGVESKYKGVQRSACEGERLEMRR